MVDEQKRKACGNCAHLIRQTESWEMSHIWWYECRERPGMENLRSFPFASTKCGAFSARNDL